MTDTPAADDDLQRLIDELLRMDRSRAEVSGLLAAFATHCATIGLTRTAERFRAGAALAEAAHGAHAPNASQA